MKTHSRFGVTIADIVAVTVNDGNTIDFTASGTNNQTITAEVVIDPAVDNITVATVDGVYTKLIDEVTYAELAALISGSDLIQGRQYLITDYRTTHTVPGTADLNTGSLEPIIVTAVDTNSLASLALSTVYPNDILYYNVSNVDQTKVQNQTMGFINRRIDTENNIDVPFDFRNVKFRRWELNVSNVWDIGVSYSFLSVVVGSDNNIYISMIAANLGNDPIVENYHWFKFPFANGDFVSDTPTELSLYGDNIPVSANYQDRLIGVSTNTIISYGSSSANANKIEKFNVVFDFLCTNVNIKVLNASGTIKSIRDSVINTGQFTYIYLNDIISSIIDGKSYIALVIGDYILNTHIHGYIGQSYIKIMDNCLFDASSFINGLNINCANSTFEYNTFSGRINGMDILYGGSSVFRNNHITDIDISANGVSFISATLVFNAYTKNIFKRSNGTARLSYVDNTDTVIYTAINA